jgi:hypothetical protein
MAPSPIDSSSEAELLRLARSLPGAGESVLCSPNVRRPGDVAAAIGRDPHSSDIPGDYCYLALGSEWKRAAPKLLAAAAALYGRSPEVAADAQALREMLGPHPGGKAAGDRSLLAATEAPRCTFQTPPAPTGPHITIRSNLRPIALLPSEDWRFRVVRAVSFTNPKLGKPSQWDSTWYCARWVALEIEWLGSCADKQRGGWPHVAIGSFGFRVPPRDRRSPGVAAGATCRKRSVREGEGEVSVKERRRTRTKHSLREQGRRRRSEAAVVAE